MVPDEPDLNVWFAQLSRRPEWHRRAACRGMGPAMFFPGKGHMPTQAIAVCSVCTVVVECRAAVGVDPETPGVWGGTTVKQRRQLRRDA
jgi:WhiB family transcriptional regulator, redox-sensing transcriptional regulator